jgi:hypothetical protein
MYRTPKRRDRGVALDLDSLMDILSCLVGVMLFLVIYTVLELGSAAYTAEVVASPNIDPDTRRVVVVAEAGTVRVLDVRPPLAELLAGFEIVRTVPEVGVFVESRSGTPRDAYFQYSLGHEVRSTSELLGMLDLVIEERPGAVGDGIDDLGAGSAYVAALEALDPEEAWIAFAVDSESIDLFRRAREMAIQRGFATGFDLLTLDFPLTLRLSGDGIDDLLSPVGQLTKPER